MKVAPIVRENSIKNRNKGVKWKASESLLVLSDPEGPKLFFGNKVVLFPFIEAPKHVRKRLGGKAGDGKSKMAETA